MGESASATSIVGLAATVLATIIVSSIAGYSQPASQPNDIEGFFAKLPGDWIGTFKQSTDGVLGDTEYLHAVIKQLTPEMYESVFTYHRLDQKDEAPVLAGVSDIKTRLETAGTATSVLTGKGDIQVDANIWKHETHELTELLRTSPTGGLQGTGSGSIIVGERNGKVQEYSSTWLLSDDVLKISQRFKVKFKVRMFSKSFTITTNYTATRGSDLIGLMKDAQSRGPER